MPTYLVRGWMILLAAMMLSIPAAAQDEVTCSSILANLDQMNAGQERDCFDLAAWIQDRRSARLFKTPVEDRISPRDMQSSAPQGPATAGSPAQSEAVPSVQPLALAGGSIAAVGTDAGASAIAALTLNPSMFFIKLDNDEAVAQHSRLADLTAFVPVDGLDQNSDGRVDYFGIRARINFNGFSQGRHLLERASQILGELTQRETDMIARADTLLREADDLEECVEVMLREAEVGHRCSGVFSSELKLYEAFQRALAATREEVDATYYGMDLRFDFGDPTLGSIPGADATALVGGLAIGRRFVETSRGSAGLRAHLAVRYVDQYDFVDSTDGDEPVAVEGKTNFGLEGGLGFELARTHEQQSIRLATGLEFRVGDAPGSLEDAFQTDHLLFRASLNVPVTAANSVSITVGAPLIGEISPTLSINANWQLLLPGF